VVTIEGHLLKASSSRSRQTDGAREQQVSRVKAQRRASASPAAGVSVAPPFDDDEHTDLPISRLGDLYVRHRWQPERGPANLYA
jgi:hypothetical protein